jgi:hypothetical protein
MRLTERKLRSIIREELSRLTEELSGEPREFVAKSVQQALRQLGLDDRLQRNTAGGRRSGEIEFVNNDDTRGFFVRGEVRRQGRGFDVEIVGRGRGRRESGTQIIISNQMDKHDIEQLADAIEEEPLKAMRRR